MRYQILALSLLTVLLGMNVLAAPAPPPSAILDIGVPLDTSETAERYLKDQIESQIGPSILCELANDPEVKKLSSVAGMMDFRPWLAKNLRVTALKGGRRIRLTFRAGTTDEKRVILNAFLRANLASRKGSIKASEESLRRFEKDVRDLESDIKSNRYPQKKADYLKRLDHLRTKQIPELRTAIDRYKSQTVIRWAR